MIIVEPGFNYDVAALKKAHPNKTIVAYEPLTALNSDNGSLKPYKDRIAAIDGLLDVNDPNGPNSVMIDLRKKEVRDVMVDLAKDLKKKGYDGVMLDAADSAFAVEDNGGQKYTGLSHATGQLVQQISAALKPAGQKPSVVMVNGGLVDSAALKAKGEDFLKTIAPSIDAISAEELCKPQTDKAQEANDVAWTKSRFAALNAATAKPLAVMFIEYMPPSDTAQLSMARAKSAALIHEFPRLQNAGMYAAPELDKYTPQPQPASIPAQPYQGQQFKGPAPATGLQIRR